jgi:hypothetical protein
MSVYICTVSGSRGRRIAIYDNKCVITTDVTLGSVLTNNAMDGQKTIFYIDVKGVQFKRCGFALGYLQVETSSIQMNNQNSNMFSENTFTFEDAVNGVPNHVMEKLHDYIVDRIESYKYHTPAQNRYLHDFVTAAEKIPACSVNRAIINQVKKELQEKADLQEQERAEQKRLREEEQQKKVEDMKSTLQCGENASLLEMFLQQASACDSIADIQTLWNRYSWDDTVPKAIERRINAAAQTERLYGKNPDSLVNLLDAIRKIK